MPHAEAEHIVFPRQMNCGNVSGLQKVYLEAEVAGWKFSQCRITGLMHMELLVKRLLRL